MISFGGTIAEALSRLEEVLSRLSNFGLQLKAKKCRFMQMEVVFLGHIVGLAVISAVVLYDSTGDVGGSGDVLTFPVLSAGGSVYPSYGPQLSPMAAEVPQ